MNIQKGTVVLSRKGRDKGYYLAVSGFDGNELYVVDGKERPIERPKKKNPKHVSVTENVLPDYAFRGNRALKKALAVFSRSQSEV